MISLGLTKLFTSARFVLPQDNIHPKFKKRKSESLRSVIFFFSLLFAGGIFVPIHGSSDPANTRQELLCWKRQGLISPRNTSLPVSTASSGSSWCLQITAYLAGGLPLLQAELPAKRALWWLMLWDDVVDQDFLLLPPHPCPRLPWTAILCSNTSSPERITNVLLSLAWDPKWKAKLCFKARWFN